MKRLKYIAFTVLLASFSLQSCDLERYPLTDLSEDNFWTDDKNAELALTSLYRGSITNGLEYSVSDFLVLSWYVVYGTSDRQCL